MKASIREKGKKHFYQEKKQKQFYHDNKKTSLKEEKNLKEEQRTTV